MSIPGTSMAERDERARGLFDTASTRPPRRRCGRSSTRSAMEPPLHGTTELRLLLARSYLHPPSSSGRSGSPVPSSPTTPTRPTRTSCSAARSSGWGATPRPGRTWPWPSCSGGMPGPVAFRATTTPADEPKTGHEVEFGLFPTPDAGRAHHVPGKVRIQFRLSCLGTQALRVGDVEVVDPLAVFDEVAGAFDHPAVS